MRRLILGIALASIVAFAPVAVQADDQAIAGHIEQKLREANQEGRLKNFGLDMQVSEGIVWFKGYVASAEQERLVLTTAQMAKNLGVVKIIDEISIQPVQQPASAVEQAAAPEPVSVLSEEAIGSGSQPAAAVEQQSALTSDEAAELAYYRQQAAAQASMLQAANYSGDAVVLPPQRMASLPRATGQMPLASAPAANMAAFQEAIGGSIQPQANLQAPAYTPVSSRRANAQYDHPSMPNYAWPSYAAHPNYGAVAYPQQYSPSAWPYIGPFYPYPQVPLGWRKVTMEWDDGWWFLNFKDH